MGFFLLEAFLLLPLCKPVVSVLNFSKAAVHVMFVKSHVNPEKNTSSEKTCMSLSYTLGCSST